MKANTLNTKNLSRETLEFGYDHLLIQTRNLWDELLTFEKENRKLKRDLQEAQTSNLSIEKVKLLQQLIPEKNEDNFKAILWLVEKLREDLESDYNVDQKLEEK